MRPTNTFANAERTLKRSLMPLYDSGEAVAIANLTMNKITGCSRSERIINPQKTLTEKEQQRFLHFKKQLQTGRPIQYILGTVKFSSLSLQVDESVLIPRPETEELVNYSIRQIKGIFPEKKDLKIIDIGSGSGCIALALKKAIPEALVYGVDVSPAAINTAFINAQKNRLVVPFVLWDIINRHKPGWLPGDFDVVISNPPYITPEEISHIHQNVVDFEPNEALFVSNSDPLQFYKRIYQLTASLCGRSGQFYLEIHEDYAQDTLSFFRQKNQSVQLLNDFQGKPRIIDVSVNID